MTIKLFNTLSRKKEDFSPLQKNNVRMYTCGPTVYNFAHIGNLRTFIFEDVLKKTLQASGYPVTHIMNITDLDDKTIQRAQSEHTKLKTLTRRYEMAFKKDLRALNISSPTRFVRATEHIDDMKKLISTLIKKKHAYIKDGSVYFSIKSFPQYGKLARLDTQSLKTNARGDVDEYEKEEVRDFALWKAAKDDEPSWPAPFGRGRPGWHIECSAMAMRYLKSPFDIHAGGIDLLFPHHENEVAQSEAATEKKFAVYWIHGAHLSVDGAKMSKSLKNDFTLRDFESRQISPIAFRYLVLTAHYRSQLNFTWESLTVAESTLSRLSDEIRELLHAAKNNKITPKENNVAPYEKRFLEALDDDLNTPQALAVIWELLHAYHKTSESFNTKKILSFLYRADKVLGLGLKKIKILTIPPAIHQKLLDREDARKNRDFALADKLRDELIALGWIIEDTPDGPRLKRK
jgi:cysteinyl-tRNA synthetase